MVTITKKQTQEIILWLGVLKAISILELTKRKTGKLIKVLEKKVW